jgi:polyhydroxybutyrate depolymerase
MTAAGGWVYRLARLGALVVMLAALALGLGACQLAPPAPTVTPTPRPTLAPGDVERSLNVAGRQRSYLLHIPPTLDPSQPAAVVFAFHGYGSSAAVFQPAGLAEMADAHGVLLVKPNGAAGSNGDLSWNAGGCCGYAAISGVDDIAFVERILVDLEGLAAIDPRRIYATGHSNGGMFAYRVACELSGTFAAVAAVSGPLIYPACQPEQPVAILHVHGLDDPIVPFAGGGSAIPGGFPAVEAGLASWAGWNGCAPEPLVETLDGGVTYTHYTTCQAFASVELYAIAGHAHPWPGPAILPMAEILWAFFEEHAR